ncbi:LacI family DNA-binding transcriptional regulator [Bacillus sp. 1P06AnD]|uniref:LacI family DNA-binding transcriptional regulator n=1 Tax=Bacillus sp. 1P06AnD TaxID=3132208 RepID=UPI0039A232D3
MKKITMMDVAARAGVSKSTVSQYLNKRFEYMSKDTKKKVEEAIAELGYVPNYIAKSLKQKSTSTIGVIVANILHSFSTKVIRAIEDVCNKNNIHVIVCNADDQPEKEKRYIEMLMAKQVDGLIVFPTGSNQDQYKSLVEASFPIVFMDRKVEDLDICTVLLDNEKAIKLAVQALHQKGYDRIAMVTTPILQNITPRVERIEGFRDSLDELGLPVNEKYIKSMELIDIQEGLQELFGSNEPPDALIAGNDLVLMEILRFLKKYSISVPDEVALIGIDDVEYAEIWSPSITTVAQPAKEMGRFAAEELLKQIRKEGLEDSQLLNRFEPQIVIRESC